MLQLHAKMLGGTAPAGGGGKEQGHGQGHGQGGHGQGGQGGEGAGDLRVLEIHSRLSQAARTHGGMLILPSWRCHSVLLWPPGTHAACGPGLLHALRRRTSAAQTPSRSVGVLPLACAERRTFTPRLNIQARGH